MSGERGSRIAGVLYMAVSSGAGFGLSLVRNKVVALLWGPAAVGVIGMMQSVASTATLVGGAGIDAVLTRELAASKDAARAQELRDAGIRGVGVWSVAFACVAAVVMVLLPSSFLLGGVVSVAVVAASVWASIASASGRAILAGDGRVGALAINGPVASLLALLVSGVLCLFEATAPVVALAVLSVPLSQWLVSRVAIGSVQRVLSVWNALRLVSDLARKAGLVAVAGVLPVAGQLLVRWFVARMTDSELFGCFQSSLALSGILTSVLASSVNSTVVPRMSALGGDSKLLSDELSSQTALYLALLAPGVGLLLVAPLEIATLLYSSRFALVAQQLPWQLWGELLRLPVWVLSSVLFVLGRTRQYFVVEMVGFFAIVLTFGCVSLWGMASPRVLGIAVGVIPTMQFLALVVLCGREGVFFSRSAWVHLIAFVAISLVGAAWFHESLAGRVAGALFVLITALNAVRLVSGLCRR